MFFIPFVKLLHRDLQKKQNGGAVQIHQNLRARENIQHKSEIC